MCGRALDDLEIGAARLLRAAQIRQQTPALEVRVHVVRMGGQTGVDLFQGLHALQVTRPRTHDFMSPIKQALYLAAGIVPFQLAHINSMAGRRDCFAP